MTQQRANTHSHPNTETGTGVRPREAKLYFTPFRNQDQHLPQNTFSRGCQLSAGSERKVRARVCVSFMFTKGPKKHLSAVSGIYQWYYDFSRSCETICSSALSHTPTGNHVAGIACLVKKQPSLL